LKKGLGTFGKAVSLRQQDTINVQEKLHRATRYGTALPASSRLNLITPSRLFNPHNYSQAHCQ
jgi:hypothetical protein